jgi:hypothetical protein
MMRQVVLGPRLDEEAAGTAALLPAEGGGGAGVAAASAASADLSTLGGLGGLGPLAPGAQAAARGGFSRAGEINLAEGDAMVCVLI